MNMKLKFLMALCFLLLLSGCKVQYEINIDEKFNLNESLYSVATGDKDIEEFSNFEYHVPLSREADDISVYIEKLEDVSYYDISVSNNYDNMKFEGRFNVEDFNNSNIASNCFKHIVSMRESDNLLISTSKGFLCFDKYDTLEEVDVKLISRFKVIDTNADKVDGYTYIWNINKSKDIMNGEILSTNAD